jgi:hypothetical protein
MQADPILESSKYHLIEVYSLSLQTEHRKKLFIGAKKTLLSFVFLEKTQVPQRFKQYKKTH